MILLLHNFTKLYYFLLLYYRLNLHLGNSTEARLSNFVESKGHMSLLLSFCSWVSLFIAKLKNPSQSKRLTLSFTIL